MFPRLAILLITKHGQQECSACKSIIDSMWQLIVWITDSFSSSSKKCNNFFNELIYDLLLIYSFISNWKVVFFLYWGWWRWNIFFDWDVHCLPLFSCELKKALQALLLFACIHLSLACKVWHLLISVGGEVNWFVEN